MQSFHKISYVATCFALTVSPSVLARDNNLIGWTLQQCISYAEEHNLDLRSKQIAIQLDQVEIDANKGALFPSLSFGTNQNVSWRPWSESYANLTDGSFSTTTSSVNYNGTYGLSAQWTAWDGGVSRKQVKRSELSKEQAQIDEKITLNDLKEQIVRLYVQILYQTEAVKVCRQIEQSTEKLEARAAEMYEVGSMSKADYVQMQAQTSQEKYNVANAETQLSEFKLQLKQLLEIVDSKDFEIAIPDIDDSQVLQLLPDVDMVYAVACASRPELQYGRIGLQAAELDIDIAKRGYYPTLGVSAGINTSASSGMRNCWTDQIKTNLSNSLGVSISVPIFDNKRNSTNVAKAKLQKENAQIEIAREEKELYNDISTTWLAARNAQEQYLYALSNVESMRESYKLVSEQFEVGLKDIVSLTTGKNNLIQAEQQLLQSRYTAVLNKTLLNFYEGLPLTLN